MAEEDETQEPELSDKQKKEIAKWFLLNSPAGEIQYVAKDIRSVLNDDNVYNAAASEAFPLYNKSHLMCLKMPGKSEDVLVTSFGEIDENEYLDPRTAQVVTVDHVKQVCTDVRPASDEELPSPYIEDYRKEIGGRLLGSWLFFHASFLMSGVLCTLRVWEEAMCLSGGWRGSGILEAPGHMRKEGDFQVRSRFPEKRMPPERCALDAEIMKYVNEAYPKGICSVCCVRGKDVEEPGPDFELVVVISAARHSPQNFCNGSWRSVWNIEFKDEVQIVDVRGIVQVGAHYFEEGNVQLDAKHEFKDSTLFQSPDDSAISLTNIIRHHETEYLAALQDLRRKLPVTRTLFPWHNTLQFSLTRDITKELGIGK
ncbi:subunits of heterodimeric actin filament capping protein Capz superfamily [Actinidia rufa]|uniref:F-actin-capping protein subunit alpha n=1 Tax=Actinidia rufa TaxID=165716 RepID=A0A7J0G8H9_9ERIC|nr:subunits of heterodimeric actin filament capping protein Capz superfamily [Actinidia rufa]